MINMSRSMFIVLIQICVLLDKIKCRTVNREVHEEIVPPSDLHYCSSPLGIARDSINIQVGFSVSSRDDDSERQQQQQQQQQQQPTDGPPSWSTDNIQHRSYIQVEFERPMLVSGIVTQGSPSTESRVTHFWVTHSEDCTQFQPVVEQLGDIMEFVGNLYINTTNTIMFDDMLLAKCIRIVPTRRIGDDTAIRFELLGCDRSVCESELSPRHVDDQQHWKKYEFDKEKIISSVKLTLVPDSSSGVPAFILAASRTCDFGSNDRIEQNGKTKIFTVEPDANELLIADQPFPIRAQCLAVFSPDPESVSRSDVYIGDVKEPLRRINNDQYQVSFKGCDALPPHDALDSCGKTRISSDHNRRQKRVVGGSTSLPGEWPWLVSLHFMGSHEFTDNSGLPHLCGGSLIHPQWVLAAAHCFDELAGEGLSDKDNWVAVLGEHYQGTIEGTEQFVNIVEIIKHPEFVLAINHELLYDITMVKLSRPVPMSDYVNTICLEPNYTVPDGTLCATAGWGIVDIDGVGVELPNSAELRIIPRAQCADNYNSLPDDDEAKPFVSIQESVICAGADQEGVDSCRGDSGGPLVCYHDEHWVQVGIVSFGYACGDIRHPGIYTNVNYFYNWIANIIENNSGPSI